MRDRGRLIVLAVGGLVIGLSVGVALVLRDGAGPGLADGQSTVVTVASGEGLGAPQQANSFYDRVPAALLIGDVTSVQDDRLTVVVGEVPWHSEDSRVELEEVWPRVGAEFTAQVVRDGLEPDVPLDGQTVAVLLDNWIDDGGDWPVVVVAVVEGQDIDVVSNGSGRLDLQLEFVAGQLGQTELEALLSIVSDMRELKDFRASSGGDDPEIKPGAAALVYEFDRTPISTRDPEAEWLARDPARRSYEEAPRSFSSATVEVNFRFQIDPEVADLVGEGSAILAVDGIAVGIAFDPSIPELDWSVLAKPGEDIQLLIGTGRTGYELIGTLAADLWVDAETVHAFVTVSDGVATASFEIEN